MRRQLWQLPRLRCDEERNQHRKVTWLELFFDLYFVVALAQLAHHLGAHPDLHGVGMFWFEFVPLIWVWVGITYYLERFETEGLENRVIFFVFMLCVGGMAVFGHDALGKNYIGYVVSYAAARCFTLLLWVRAGRHDRRFSPVSRIYLRGFGAGQACAVASLLVPVGLRLPLLAAALLLDVVTPLFALRANQQLPKVSTTKHPERFGLFTIVVLGETVVGVVAGLIGTKEPNLVDAVGAGLGVLIGFSLWWIYFDFVARRPFKPGPAALYAWVYLHVLLYGSVVMTGAAILNATVHGDGVLPADIRYLVTSGLGLFLISVGLLETTLVHADDEPTHRRLSPALKIVAGVALPFVGMIELDKFAFFPCFYPLLAIHMGYGLWVWFTQEIGEPAAGDGESGPDVEEAEGIE